MLKNLKKDFFLSFIAHFICFILIFYLSKNLNIEKDLDFLEPIIIFTIDAKFNEINNGRIKQEPLISLQDTDNTEANDNKVERIDDPLNVSSYGELEYLQVLKSRIEKVWDYPTGLPKGYYEVEIKFAIESSGNLLSLELIKSSGKAEFDNSVLNAIVSAFPFLPFPEGWNEKKISIKGRFVFDMEVLTIE